jgi:prefoldin alpha subunit
LSSDPSLAGGEEEIRRLLGAYQQYQAQAEAIAQQLGLTQMTVQGLDRAIVAVEALDSANDGQEMLVPIGSGSFVFAKLASKERVVLNVGAGVSMEKPVAEAKESLKVRKAEVAEAAKKLSEMLNKIDGEMAKIQSVISKYETGTEQVV